MRVGLVCPYSYTYPGGVLAHVEALADELRARGHEVRVLAPVDPDDRLTRVLHRGARPVVRDLPDRDKFVPLGRTIGFESNGAISNLSHEPVTATTLGHELRSGWYDVMHVHEPNAGIAPWFTIENSPVPVVATFHAYATKPVPMAIANVFGQRRLFNKLSLRIAVSDAARWTGERFYGGHYRVVPNGIDLSRVVPGPKPRNARLDLLFVGRAEERKGLPVLMRAFEALRTAGVDAHLTVAGATDDEVAPLLLDTEGVHIAGRVSEDEKWRLLHQADLLCAPSLGGESFGIVLLEALASGTPVVCSDIPGYRDVVRDGVEGRLVPPGDPVALGEAIRALASTPERRAEFSSAARERAERFAWPHVAQEVERAYEDALAVRVPETRKERIAVAAGVKPADGEPRSRARRVPTLEPGGRRPIMQTLRRAAVVIGGLGAVGLAVLAVQRIGAQSIANALLNATPTWMVLGLALMCLAMTVRVEAWHAILRAALPGVRVRRRDVGRATMIGVLMSATLPARLGEPSRALIVARRVGRVRERLPVVVGSLVSQTLLNLVALFILGFVMFATVGFFRGHEKALLAFTIAPFVVLLVVLALPALLRRGPSRFMRLQRTVASARAAMLRVRSGLAVFRSPRLGLWAATTQLLAWGIQWLSCYTLMVALGLHAGIGAAAGVLFAVNVTAVLPATPSNLGVFQAACVAVLSAYHVSHTDALAYGIVLQAVEIATAVIMGMPALLGEGMSFKDMRLRALHSSPVELKGFARGGNDAVEADA